MKHLILLFIILSAFTLQAQRQMEYLSRGVVAVQAGRDSVFHPANHVWIARNRVYVKSDSVAHPVAVRYAWSDWAVGDLMHDGLPVSSFRTDF